MAKIVFKIQKAKEHGKSPIEIVLDNNGKKYVKIVENTDFLLPALDTLLKKSKIKLESVKDIKIKAHKEAGLTSQRIIKAIAKALSFEL